MRVAGRPEGNIGFVRRRVKGFTGAGVAELEVACMCDVRTACGQISRWRDLHVYAVIEMIEMMVQYFAAPRSRTMVMSSCSSSNSELVGRGSFEDCIREILSSVLSGIASCRKRQHPRMHNTCIGSCLCEPHQIDSTQDAMAYCGTCDCKGQAGARGCA